MNYSVLMSVYYKEKPDYLKLSIESMLKQTVISNDIVIVKDGPLTSELNNIIDSYIRKYPNIFKVVESRENIGLGRALNLGLENCKNELIARMDTDDISLRDRCEKQLKVFKSNKSISIVGTWINEFYENPEKIISSRKVPTDNISIYEFGKRRSPFNHPTVMYKKSEVMKFGGYKGIRRNQDVDLFGRMIFGGCEAANIPESLLLFRANKELSKRRQSWDNTWSYINTIKQFWQMGYSTLLDLIVVFTGQITMFLCPISMQNIIYKKILRK